MVVNMIIEKGKQEKKLVAKPSWTMWQKAIFLNFKMLNK